MRLGARKISGIVWVYGIAFVGLAFILVSLMGNAVGSFSIEGDIGTFTLSNYVDLFKDEELGPVTLRTLMLGVGSVAVMMLFAFPFAWLITRTDFPWKGPLFTLLTAKLAIPGFITAMAYIWLFNPSSGLLNKMFNATGIGAEPIFNVYQLSWICFLQGIVLTPACVFMMLPAFRNMDASLEEAAWVSGVSKFETIRRVVLPLLGPGVLAATLFFFVISIEIFDIVALIGMPGEIEVLVIWIFDAMHPVMGIPNFGLAGAIGMLLFALCGVAIMFYIRMLRQANRYAVIGGKARRFSPQPLGKWKWPAVAFVGFWVFAAVVLPVITLIWVALVPYLQPFSMKAVESMTLISFEEALTYMGGPLRNTAIITVGAIIISITLAASLSWVVTRSRNRAAHWADGIVFLSPAVPTMVAAVAFQFMGISLYSWVPLYGTIWLIAIAMGVRMLAYCTRTMNASSIQIHFELDEVARTSGVSQLMSFRWIFIPIMMPAIFYSALMVGMLAARDLTIPLVMNTGKAATISTLIFDLQSNGDQNAAGAISLYMIVLLALLAVAAHKLTGMSELGVGAGRPRRRKRARRREPAPSPAE
ncbi:MAG: iron ABC transporter permease [Pseudomonadota bacterium]|nr:iron ABC transporter permease [Pseudomonadota bacterium]